MTMPIDERPVVALLPMKANSERVPGKNFRPLAGKPLFRWMLDTLLDCARIGEVIVNTDARAIIEAAGLPDDPRVRIRDRRPELCGDLVSMNRIIEDDLADSQGQVYLMTHTTNPLLGRGTIEAGIESFLRGLAQDTYDSLFTVNRIQTRFYRADGSPVNHDPDNLVRTQDLEPWFEENSNLYLFTKESFSATRARIGRRPMMLETSRLESIDIDTPEDWEFAELAAELHARRGAAGGSR